MDNIEALAKEVKDLAASFETREKSWDEKIETLLKEKHNVDKAMVSSDKETPYYRGFLGARKDIASGKVAKSVLWDDKTEKQFVEWVHLVKDNARGEIQKTFGDNQYTETTTAGGYLVPTVFVPELIRAIYYKSLMLPKVKIVPMPVSKITLPSVTAGYSAAWGTINTQVTDSKVTLGQVALSAEKLVALSLVPNELMEDSGLPIASLLADEFSSAFASRIDEEIIAGDATDTSNHKFNGWQYASNTVGYSPGVDASPTLAEEVTIDNLMAEVAAVQAADTYGLVDAEWFFHPTVWAIIRALQSTSPTLPLVGMDKNWQYDMLGFPVNVSAHVVCAETAAKPWACFGNPKYMIFGDMGGLSIESSKDYRFGEDQTTFLARQRCAVAAGVPTSLGVMKFGAAS